VIDAQDLTKDFDTVRALDGLSFRARPGEIVGFLGPNGAGKSTTLKILTGMIKPSGGRGLIAGLDVADQPLEVKRRIGYVPESGAVYEALTPSEYLDLVGALHHMDRRTCAGRAAELLELFDLGARRHQTLATLSKGMKQKVLIAAAILHRPEVLLLDEPLTGLDAGAARLVKELLRALAAQGRTVLFSSHILDVVERSCQRIVVIDRGKKLAEGTPAELLATTGCATLDEAFSRLTGAPPVKELTAEVLAALER
jgi:ABC-2 type transport system ATP-binding protein